jgi:nucleoside-diphosphate-sugar epimerase
VIAVTGATGYLGGLLCSAFERGGRPVRRLTRTPQPTRGDRRFVLDEPVADETLSGVTTLVHAAYDFRPTGEAELRRVNLDGSRRLFEAARLAGVSRLLFVSSMAAFAESRGAYGRIKYALEQDVAAAGGTAVRPGLIYGRERGGLFASLDRAVRTLPVLPDFGPRAVLVGVHAADLVAVVEAFVAGAIAPALLPVAHPERLTFRRILAGIAEAASVRARFVPVPPALAIAAMRSLEAVGVRLPFRSESLTSMIHVNPSPGLAEEALGVSLRPFDARSVNV